MWSPLSKSGLLLLAATALPYVSAKPRVITSSSLNPCMENSRLTANLFNIAFTPNNNSLGFDVEGMSTISGRVMAQVELFVYGYSALKQTVNPCDSKDFEGLCPMNAGSIDLNSNVPISAEVMSNIPGVAYTIPDLDAKVRIRIHNLTTNEVLACVEAELSNGHSVHQKPVAWVTAVIAGLGLVASAVTSGLGHTNTAAHVAANAMSLFGYFQAQALLGMMAVPLPPIVAAWTQNFQWSMGIIRVGFLQRLATWYQRSTGGTPSTHLSSLSVTSIRVQKRSFEMTDRMARLVGRSNAGALDLVNKEQTVLRGIARVGFRAKMETTNIFMTGYIFFIVFILLTTLSVIAFKFICEGLVKAGKMKSDKFVDFRNGWQTVLKGIMYRVVLIGFPQMMVLCFWEYTQRDSPAEVVLAVFTMITMIGILAWASSKVVRIAQRSIVMHKNPAYILYSDPVALNKWGFLYVQFKAAAYWFIIPLLVHVLIKALFIGVAQMNGKAQAIALLLIEAALLVGVCVMRPYMDKKTNGFNIAIAAINFVGAICFLFFSDIFGAPAMASSVVGVVFFVYNCIFALVLLLMVLVSSGFALFTKNPDTRYQPMRDDRGSFIKSQTQLTTELDALGATARGEGKGTHPQSRIDDDDDSFSSTEHQRQMASKEGHFSEHYQAAPPRSPMERSVSPYGGQQQQQQTPSSVPPSYYGSNSPAPSNGYGRAGSLRNEPINRGNNNSSPWQRGAGYDGH